MTDLVPLTEAARRLSDKASWFLSDEGREEMLDKGYVPGSVHRSLVVDILHDLADSEGLDPLRTVRAALVVFFGEQACQDRRILQAAEAIGKILDADGPA